MTKTSHLTTETLVRLLGANANRFDIDILESCDSTNSALMARAEGGAASGTVIVARHQVAGRGRRGRTWISAAGDSLTFSLLWRLANGQAPAGLSLAAGVAVARAVSKYSATKLKWPNDILLGEQKLGGILVELVPGATNTAVIGVGINLRLPEAMPEELRNHSAALPINCSGEEVLANILAELLQVLEQFSADGFESIRDEWVTYHAHQGKPVQLLTDFAPPRHGICRGVDVDGALLLEADGVVERILSGEISLRSAA